MERDSQKQVIKSVVGPGNQDGFDALLCQIFGEHEPLKILTNCNLVSFGQAYQHLRQVYRSIASSNGKLCFSRKIVASKNEIIV